MDPVAGSSLLQLGAQHGPFLLIAVAALFACWRLTERIIDRQDKQLEQRDLAHRTEREADRTAHLAALGALTDKVAANGQAIEKVGEDVRELQRDLRPARLRGG